MVVFVFLSGLVSSKRHMNSPSYLHMCVYIYIYCYCFFFGGVLPKHWFAVDLAFG